VANNLVISYYRRLQVMVLQQVRVMEFIIAEWSKDILGTITGLDENTNTKIIHDHYIMLS
jgi:hypothetical protein